MFNSLDLNIDNDQKKWYVLSAYRQERKAESVLADQGVRCFVPKRYVVTEVGGKRIRVLQPAVANLVFAYVSWNEIMAIKQRHPFLQLQTQVFQKKRRVMTVPEVEMESFIKIASQTEADLRYYRTDELAASAGQRVRIIGGSFDGVEGCLVKIAGKQKKRVVVELDGLMAIAAVIEPEYIQPL